MAMVVQHNLTASNANRQLAITTGAQAKSSEKLSSGYRINRAGDDAAGLKISEKMRSQVRGLKRASTNAQDGVSLIQTAEGALNEAHSILQRMNELAVQGANDTNEKIDRDAIDQELAALTAELDRISETTQFNKQNLLDGKFTNKKLQVGANADQKIEISISNMNAKTLGLTSITTKSAKPGVKTVVESITVASTLQNTISIGKVVYNGVSKAYVITTTYTKNMNNLIKSFQKDISESIRNLSNKAYGQQMDPDTRSLYFKDSHTSTRYLKRSTAVLADLSVAKAKVDTELTNNGGKYLKTSTKTLSTPTFANKAYTSKRVKASAVPSVAATVISVPKVTDYETANATLKAVQAAIDKVSEQRSALGALQNRLEHTIANLDNVAENTQAAESRIRDTDMASEMVEFSKNNILAQAGQSMLAQSNQATQGVLSLLQ